MLSLRNDCRLDDLTFLFLVSGGTATIIHTIPQEDLGHVDEVQLCGTRPGRPKKIANLDNTV
jgi:hypothetical protein